MKENIDIMLNAQSHWQKISDAKNKIEKYKKSIEKWQNTFKENEKSNNKIKNEITTIKGSIKDKETDLMEIDEQKSSLQQKRLQAVKEKELKAFDKEIEIKSSEADVLENALLELYDTLSIKEDELKKNTLDQKESLETGNSDIDDLNNRIKNENKNITENSEAFETHYDAIHNTIKQRFKKLLESKNGVGVCEVKNEVCTGCNFQVPPALANDALNSSNIITCTNCGRYIFVRS